MLTLEQPDVQLPGLLIGVIRHQRPVTGLSRERSHCIFDQPAADRILPVRGMDGELPDVVTPTSRTPQRLLVTYAPQRPAKRRTVPPFDVECLVENFEQKLDPLIHALACDWCTHPASFRTRVFSWGATSVAKRRARSNRKASVSVERLAPSLSPKPASHPILLGEPEYHAPPWST